MGVLTIVYWRDIPAQLMIGSGRHAIKLKLSEKYEQAIDRCAMKVGSTDSDSYLKDWRKESTPLSNQSKQALEEEAFKLELEYSDKKLKELIANNGWNNAAH